MKLMKKKNFYTNQLQIKKSLRTKIYEFLKDEIKKEGIKKKTDEEQKKGIRMKHLKEIQL